MDLVTLVVDTSTIDVPRSLLARWSGLARMFMGDNPGESQMVLSAWRCETVFDKGAAVRAFVRFGLKDGTPMDDGDALGAVSVAHLMNATTEWFMTAYEGLQSAIKFGQHTPASHSMWLYAFARDVGIARYMGKRLMTAWDAVGHQTDVDAAWRAMNAANDAFTTHCKVHQNALPIVMGCDVYVKTCIRSGHFDHIILSLAPITVRPGSLLHELCFQRYRFSDPVDPVKMQESIRREVDAGHLSESDYCQMLLRTLGNEETAGTVHDLERIVHRRQMSLA